MRDLKYINDESQQIECKIRRLDDFCTEQKIDHVDFIKCDVEGAEFFVFRGGLGTIKKADQSYLPKCCGNGPRHLITTQTILFYFSQVWIMSVLR